jgi:hypothetical protein
MSVPLSVSERLDSIVVRLMMLLCPNIQNLICGVLAETILLVRNEYSSRS